MPPPDADAGQPPRRPQADGRRQDPAPRRLRYSLGQGVRLRQPLRPGGRLRDGDGFRLGCYCRGYRGPDRGTRRRVQPAIRPARTQPGLGGTDRQRRRFPRLSVADADSAVPTDFTTSQACLHQPVNGVTALLGCVGAFLPGKTLAGGSPRRPLSSIPLPATVTVWNSRAHVPSPYQPISSVAFHVLRSAAEAPRAGN